jgi:hypothetical protein
MAIGRTPRFAPLVPGWIRALWGVGLVKGLPAAAETGADERPCLGQSHHRANETFDLG